MIFNKLKNIGLLLLFPLLFSAVQAIGNPLSSDSLSLSGIISEVVQNHPMVKKAMEELNSSDARIGLAQSGKLPNIDLSSSYSRVGPVIEIHLPDVGSFNLMPKDNYAAAVSLNQTLFDFGKTDKNILLEKKGKELTLQAVEQVKQRLSQLAIANYFTLTYLQEAIKIKEEQLKTLNAHLDHIQKKQATGSATQYEVLTTQVRISTIENQKTDLESARKIQLSQLNSLLGKPQGTPLLVKAEVDLAPVPSGADTLIAKAMQNRDEMKLARQKTALAEMRYDLTAVQNNPVINGFLSGGVKNGYIPYMYDPKANFIAGISLKVPVFDGRRNKYNLIQAKSAILENNQETEIARRSIANEVVEAEANLSAALKKVDQSELQLRQADQAYTLGLGRFESGVITNLELLDSSTALSESRLMVLKSKIEYTVNLFKLKSATGERLY